MKTMIARKYGPPEVLVMREVEKPDVKADEVLIRIYATTVTAGDCETRRFDMPNYIWLPMRIFMGVRKPKWALGTELAGVVEAVGQQVTRFRKGDSVFAFAGLKFGAYAEYIALQESGRPEKGIVARMPRSVSYEEAATVHIGGLNALGFLRKAGLGGGQSVLIYGASGSIGTFAVQIAKIMGAEVTAVCSEKHFEMVRSIGADHVIDYTKEDYVKAGKQYDCVLDAVGKDKHYHGLRAVKKGGNYVEANPKLFHLLTKPAVALATGKRVFLTPPAESVDDLITLGKYMEEGKLRSVIDRIYPFEQMAEAHRYVELGHKSGNVAIRLVDPGIQMEKGGVNRVGKKTH